MSRLKNIFSCVIVIYCVTGSFGMRCEDSRDQNFYGFQEPAQYRILLNDLKDIKNDMDNLKQQIPASKIKDLPMFDIRYDTLPEKCRTQRISTNCGEATACTKRSGYYHIQINAFSNNTFIVECDAHTEGGDWTVIQRRQDGSENFYRTWSDYKVGFGDIDAEFFIGLDKLHALTNYDGPQELLILMENGSYIAKGFAKYDTFRIGDESEKYVLKHIGHYTGTAGDGMTYHLGMKFSTKDQDNDPHPTANTAELYMGAWWYTEGHASNLNAHYGDARYAKGVGWYHLSGHTHSLTYVKMMIRRRRN